MSKTPPHFKRAKYSAKLIEKFGRVMRATSHKDGTPESDTTHTVMLQMVALDLVYEEFGLQAYQADRHDKAAHYSTVAFVLIHALHHDLPEAYAGDVNTMVPLSEASSYQKKVREDKAIEKIAKHNRPTASTIDDYEDQDTKEARFIKVLDKAMPKLMHAMAAKAGVYKSAAQQAQTLDDLILLHQNQRQVLEKACPDVPVALAFFDYCCDLCERVW